MSEIKWNIIENDGLKFRQKASYYGFELRILNVVWESENYGKYIGSVTCGKSELGINVSMQNVFDTKKQAIEFCESKAIELARESYRIEDEKYYTE